ncbi:MAG: DUF5020 family protein [Methylococcaceae bacterium]|nr:DUF5020 family protein [Methylococcaceae bacterium]
MISFSSLSWALQPFDWTSNDIQYLYGGDFIFSEQNRSTVTIEHADGWQYGSNFFFVDMYNNNGFEVYAEVYSYLSLNKIFGADLSLGPIKDFSLAGGINISNQPEEKRFQAYLVGISLDLANKYFDYLQLDIMAYKDDGLNSWGVQVTPVWSFPFELGSTKFKFRGFVDIKDGNTNALGHVTMLAQPQLLLDVGDLAGWKSDIFYIGTEYSFWLNKFGVEDANESAWQGMIIGFF